ncbi:uncharacterized protein LOC116957635 [Petromyzon marinus]|uniref:uncharacterized protein LOC116957635 n=1 Tax=Petromyzon marinus TaxID=7757 RepID=UPI003F707A8C
MEPLIVKREDGEEPGSGEMWLRVKVEREDAGDLQEADATIKEEDVEAEEVGLCVKEEAKDGDDDDNDDDEDTFRIKMEECKAGRRELSVNGYDVQAEGGVGSEATVGDSFAIVTPATTATTAAAVRHGESRAPRQDWAGASPSVAEIEVTLEDDIEAPDAALGRRSRDVGGGRGGGAPATRHACSLCGRSFVRPSALKSHAMTHTGERPHGCPVCAKRFAHPSDLRIHARIHTGERPHACPDCSKVFVQSSNLRSHMRIHTGERPHACHACGKRYIHPSELRSHARTHTGERPHVCGVCGKGFLQSSNLKSHARIHTGERPHVCAVCGKGFMQSSTLKSHAITHTDDRPFRCAVCDRSFRRPSVLKSHLLAHAGGRRPSLGRSVRGRGLSSASRTSGLHVGIHGGGSAGTPPGC